MRRAKWYLLILVVLFVGYLQQSGDDEAGRVDAWTWDAPDLKTRTSPNKQKRARADVEDGKIELKFGEAGQAHPVDMWPHYSEIIPEPQDGQWAMKWINDDEFVFETRTLERRGGRSEKGCRWR